MLSTRIIPVLLRRGNSLVKGRQFDSWRSVGHPLQAARIHAAREVDELMILDLSSDQPDYAMAESLTRCCFTPITIGGGIKSVGDIQNLLRAGADKICLKNRSLIKEASTLFGSQAICVSLEIRNVDDAVGIAMECEAVGAGEILLQTVADDGMLHGYNTDLIHAVSSAVGIPVIASCGCGTYQHMLEAVEAGASAVAAGAMFQFTDSTPLGAARYLSDHGIKTRL